MTSQRDQVRVIEQEIYNWKIMERRVSDDLKDEFSPDETSGEFSLDKLEMLRVIGTGTFARVCLCQVFWLS